MYCPFESNLNNLPYIIRTICFKANNEKEFIDHSCTSKCYNGDTVSEQAFDENVDRSCKNAQFHQFPWYM